MGILFRQKRKRIWLFLLAVCCSLFIGCDPVADIKPVVFPNTRWVCEELDVWFIVDPAPAFSAVYYGQMKQGDTVQEIGFYPGAGPYGWINTFDSVADGVLSSEQARNNVLWTGKVNYNKDRFVLISSDSNKLFPEDAFPIEFIREDLTEEEIREISPWDEDGNLKNTENAGAAPTS